MFGVEKKKRSTSGTRSKSRKLKESIDLKPRQVTCNLHESKSRMDDYNLHPLGRPKRKLSKSKKHTYITLTQKIQCQGLQSNKRITQEISHSVSADRKHSHPKGTRTEADPEDIDKQLHALKRALLTISHPQYPTIPQVQQYYGNIRNALTHVPGPLSSILLSLHQMYVKPLQSIFTLYAPYEQLLREQKELMRLINQQTMQNETLQRELDPIDADIFKYKQIVEQQRALIEQKKKEIQTRVKEESTKDVKGFKLDLRGVQNKSIVGFHDQFYSKIDEFSESWRDQALREKKF